MCSQKNWGGTLKETTLWTNSAPTSAFAGQTVTLSEEITNYDFIRIYFYVSRSITNEYSTLMSISDFLVITGGANEPRCMMGNSTPSYNYFRMARKDTADNKIYFTTAYNNANSTSNDQLIPTKICGVK